MQARWDAFLQIEKDIDAVAVSNPEEEKRLSERDEAYLTLPLDPEVAINNLNLIHSQIIILQEKPQRKEFEKQRLMLELQREKDSEACNLQLGQLEIKEQQSFQARKKESSMEI